jgi:DNA-binding transcriptional LysR family regulator
MIPDALLRQIHLESGKLVQLLQDYVVATGTLYAVFLPDPNLPERIRAFVRFLADRFAPCRIGTRSRTPGSRR